MNDLIEREAAIEALEREKTYCTAFRDGYAPINVFEKYNAGLTDGIKALKNLPSAQPEIIRCKDCKYWEKDGWCSWQQQGDPNWFCADGERRQKQ